MLQELIHGNRFYPDDGGDKSHQLVDLVSALKCQYPERVHLILGNHELSELTGRVIGKNGRALNADFRAGIETAYGERAGDIYDAYKALFAALPLAVRTPNRVFVCHTIPDARFLDDLDLGVLKADDWPPEAMSAAAPSTPSPGAATPSPRPSTASPRSSTPTGSSPATSPARRGSASPTTARSSSTAPTPAPPTSSSPPAGRSTPRPYWAAKHFSLL